MRQCQFTCITYYIKGVQFERKRSPRFRCQCQSISSEKLVLSINITKQAQRVTAWSADPSVAALQEQHPEHVVLGQLFSGVQNSY